ncbi:hypothetical protein [Tropicibacter naphthalenivorans]|uniref:Uncharacterized protein n=1 Tax=Tropicibacter naphthalenivorans TaxID=441103 RepID=A0A0P1FZ66_9RHOB|nr:hypothetical protein [Tropicibacter naphthalenivorans]CUH74708.1 hypothetical protein TRN7648_00042 [Tropicibacter naphthalenivorans]SMC49646.1 hypothetical protein SAMN04488093_101838 [Tropicibacter naphthalenivorans]
MGTQAALMMVAAIVSVLLPLVVVNCCVHRRMKKRKCEEFVKRSREAGRLAVVSVTVAVMCTAVFYWGPTTLAPDMLLGIQ